jgi:hypothetical protein
MASKCISENETQDTVESAYIRSKKKGIREISAIVGGEGNRQYVEAFPFIYYES